MTDNISDEDIDDCIEFIEGISGIVFSRDRLKALLDDDEDLADEIAEWGVDDTETSGSLASFVAEHLLDRPWPLYGDKVDIDAFVGELRKAAEAKGYKITASQP